jgi:hypothetical protein
MSRHTVFVLSLRGTPLTPTTPAKARKLLKAGVASPLWSRFGTFGIRLRHSTREEQPPTSLGGDQGTKYEGYSILCGEENPFNVKLDLPDKKQIVRRLKQRRELRRARRSRNCRRRARRCQNRVRPGFVAPSQQALLQSRMAVIQELARLYPVRVVAYEDVYFDLQKHRCTGEFSTVDAARARMRELVRGRGILWMDFKGIETKILREQYGYKKCKNKAANRFEAHCCDSLTLAVVTTCQHPVEPGPFVVVDDTLRPIRRQLHAIEPSPGGARESVAHGAVNGLRRGLLIGLPKGKRGQLFGEVQGRYRYHDEIGKRQSAKEIRWISSNFVLRAALPPIRKGTTP